MNGPRGPLTPEEILAEFRRSGESVAGWAKRRGYPPHTIYDLLHGKTRGRHGLARNAAIDLGIRVGERNLEEDVRRLQAIAKGIGTARTKGDAIGVDQARRIAALEDENEALRGEVADLLVQQATRDLALPEELREWACRHGREDLESLRTYLAIMRAERPTFVRGEVLRLVRPS